MKSASVVKHPESVCLGCVVVNLLLYAFFFPKAEIHSHFVRTSEKSQVRPFHKVPDFHKVSVAKNEDSLKVHHK